MREVYTCIIGLCFDRFKLGGNPSQQESVQKLLRGVMYLEYLGDIVQAVQWKVFESESSEEQWHL